MLAISAVLATIWIPVARTESECVPSPSTFHRGECPDFHGKKKIQIKSMIASQAGVPVVEGIDLTVPLNLTFNINYNGRPIKDHKTDQAMSQYVRDDDGNCNWMKIDTNGLGDDTDVCPMINVDCSYASHPTNVVTIVNFQEMLGPAVDALIIGRYYAFAVTERDGSQFLNCFWIQAKVLKTTNN